jgi:hypothetical protein
MKRHSVVVILGAAALALSVSSVTAAAERAWVEVKSRISRSRPTRANRFRSRVLWNLSRTEEAETAARNALTLARSDGDRRAAQELLDFFQKNRAKQKSEV